MAEDGVRLAQVEVVILVAPHLVEIMELLARLARLLAAAAGMVAVRIVFRREDSVDNGLPHLAQVVVAERRLVHSSHRLPFYRTRM